MKNQDTFLVLVVLTVALTATFTGLPVLNQIAYAASGGSGGVGGNGAHYLRQLVLCRSGWQLAAAVAVAAVAPAEVAAAVVHPADQHQREP